MTRLGAVFWGGLVLASGFATFNVKYAVQGIDDELASTRRQTLAEQQEIRVLSAEWAYLNQPERLAELNRSFLQLAPITAKQLQGRIEEIAMRAAPAVSADTMIASAGTAAAPPATVMAAAVPAPPAAAAPAAAARGETAVAADRMVVAPAAAAHANHAPSAGAGSPEAQLADATGGAPTADTVSEGATALAEALHLLGIDNGGQTARARLAKAIPIAAAHAAELHGAEATGGQTPVADAASGGAGTTHTPPNGGGEAALAEARHLLGIDNSGQTPRVRLAKAAPASLDALISKIADRR